MSDSEASSSNTSKEGNITDDGVVLEDNSGINSDKTGHNDPLDRDRQKSRERSHDEVRNNEKEEEPLSFKRKRFETSREGTRNERDLPEEMMKYARKHFNE